MTSITLVPRLRPAIDGVGDYAFQLAKQIRKDFSLTTQFLVGDPDWDKHHSAIIDRHEGFRAEALSARSAQLLADYLKTTSTVILHYVPHGYASKACPFWLIKGLESWHNSTQNAKLITMFHELYACDWQRPWSSDFYLSPIQRNLAAQIARLSDVCLTSTARYTRLINGLSQNKHTQIPALPVFSNFGEPSQLKPLNQREQRLVILGQSHSKRLIYQKSTSLLERICHDLDVEEIWDIGPSTDLAPSYLGKIKIQKKGNIHEKEVSQILTSSLVGFLNYDPKRIGKSSIFAAYCAHGMFAINHRSLPEAVDGVETGQHYWFPQEQPIEIESAQRIADNALSWYRQHSLDKQASIFFEYLVSAVKHTADSRYE